MRLRPKLTLAMFAVSLLVSGLITTVLYRFIERRLESDLRDRLHDITHIGSRSIDAAAYQRLGARLADLDAAAVADVERSADFRAVSNQLQVLRSADPGFVRYVYLLAPGDDPSQPRFVVDADVLAPERAREGATRVSHFGQPYDAARVPQLARALRECTEASESEFVVDEAFGVESVSVYTPLVDATGAPMRDGRGRCSGVLGVDITRQGVASALADARRLEIGLSIAGISLALLAAVLLGGVLTRSIAGLTAVVRRFGEKDFAARTQALAADEIGELGRSFDAMAEIIQQHGAELEKLVQLRTHELTSEQGVRAQRDVQLAEAHAEVRAAQAPGEGRYTGQKLGDFQMGIVIGRGAMGEVYEGTDPSGTQVAVKVLAASLAGDESAVRRFHREARAVASLHTSHIVKLVDVSPADAPIPYIVMERLEGTDLSDQLKGRSVLPLAEVVAIVGEIALGLDAAHQAGVVHRDLKPANVFGARSSDGRVTWKILDFGVSKSLAADATMSAAAVVGTPSYMAPEQARGGHVDARTDLYALGVMTYRLLTGRPTVVPGQIPTMLFEVAYHVPARPSDLVSMPPQVEAVLAIALAKRPDDRFAAARELAESLAAAAEGKLAAELITRAEDIVTRAPWGTRISPGSREAADDADTIIDDETPTVTA